MNNLTVIKTIELPEPAIRGAISNDASNFIISTATATYIVRPKSSTLTRIPIQQPIQILHLPDHSAITLSKDGNLTRWSPEAVSHKFTFPASGYRSESSPAAISPSETSVVIPSQPYHETTIIQAGTGTKFSLLGEGSHALSEGSISLTHSESILHIHKTANGIPALIRSWQCADDIEGTWLLSDSLAIILTINGRLLSINPLDSTSAPVEMAPSLCTHTAFSTRLGLFASATQTNELMVYNCADSVTSLRVSHNAAIIALSICDASGNIAALDQNGRTAVWKRNENVLELILPWTVTTSTQTGKLAFSPNGEKLLICSFDGTRVLSQITIANGKIEQTVCPHQIRDIAFFGTGGDVAIATPSGLYKWSLGQQPVQLSDHPVFILRRTHDGVFSVEGSSVVPNPPAPKPHQSLHRLVHRTNDNRILPPLWQDSLLDIRGIRYSMHDKTIAIVSRCYPVQLHESGQPHEYRTVSSHNGPVVWLDFLDNETKTASLSLDGYLHISSIPQGETVKINILDDSVIAAQRVPATNSLLVWTDKGFFVYNIDQKQLRSVASDAPTALYRSPIASSGEWLQVENDGILNKLTLLDATLTTVKLGIFPEAVEAAFTQSGQIAILKRHGADKEVAVISQSGEVLRSKRFVASRVFLLEDSEVFVVSDSSGTTVRKLDPEFSEVAKAPVTTYCAVSSGIPKQILLSTPDSVIVLNYETNYQTIQIPTSPFNPVIPRYTLKGSTQISRQGRYLLVFDGSWSCWPSNLREAAQFNLPRTASAAEKERYKIMP